MIGIIGFFIGAIVGITIMCILRVAKDDNYMTNDMDIDLTTVYLSGFYNGEDKWKDKIKEYKNQYEEILKICNKKEDTERIKSINERIMTCEDLLTIKWISEENK